MNILQNSPFKANYSIYHATNSFIDNDIHSFPSLAD